MPKYALARKNSVDIDKLTLFKGIALLSTGVGAYYLFRKSAVPVIGGASAYLIASVMKASDLQAAAAAAAGTGIAFVAERALQKKKDDSWCKEHYIQALWDDRCVDPTGDALGYLDPKVSRPKYYSCIWRGAQDATAGDCVSALVNLLHDAGFPPSSYPNKLEDSYLKQTPYNAIFDVGVETALRQFQKSRGLKEDGIAGPNTWWALGVMNPLTPRLDCSTVAGQGEYTTVAKIKEAEKLEEEKEKTKPAPIGIPWWAWAVTGVGVASLAGIVIYKSVKKKKKAVKELSEE
jgi:peptidoglycan hydrolase-like protein with peptidoglycan-binding domain